MLHDQALNPGVASQSKLADLIFLEPSAALTVLVGSIGAVLWIGALIVFSAVQSLKRRETVRDYPD